MGMFRSYPPIKSEHSHLHPILYQLEKRQRRTGWLFVYDNRGTDGNITVGTMCEGGARYSVEA
jgi:hypothetical protein